MTNTLFPISEGGLGEQREMMAEPRVQRPERNQLELRAVDLEGLLPPEHRARLVWEFVEGLDLTPLYRDIKAVEGHAGRPAIDPAILMALWLYATMEGVGSARALARLCEQHDAYRWMCGGVGVNYHTLADFRVGHGAYLDEVLTVSVATLMAEGLVDLRRVSQDGLRVRAHAGAGSFRRRPRLEQCLAEATTQIEALRQELDADPGATTRRQQAARQRAAQERHTRVARALGQWAEVAARRKKGVSGARVSTTDPEARVMKMADGGFRPAFNAQLATATADQIIVGVDVTNAGADQGQLRPMLEQLQRRYGHRPGEILADGGYVTRRDVTVLGAPEWGCTVYAPPPAPRGPRRRHDPRRDDPPVLAEWRRRMATATARAIYKERAATSECVNAMARNRGLQQFLVRGLAKVKTVVLWFALAHNLVRAAALRRAAGLVA